MLMLTRGGKSSSLGRHPHISHCACLSVQKAKLPGLGDNNKVNNSVAFDDKPKQRKPRTAAGQYCNHNTAVQMREGDALIPALQRARKKLSSFNCVQCRSNESSE